MRDAGSQSQGMVFDFQDFAGRPPATGRLCHKPLKPGDSYLAAGVGSPMPGLPLFAPVPARAAAHKLSAESFQEAEEVSAYFRVLEDTWAH